MNRPGYISQVECHVIPEPVKLETLADEYIDLAGFRLVESPEAAWIAPELRSLFGLTGEGGGRLTVERWVDAPSPDAYRLRVEPERVSIECGTRRGGLYALETIKQLRVAQFLPVVAVEDYPALALRGFHTNLASIRQFDFAAVMRFIDLLAKFKINLWLLEYNQRFPYAAPHGVLSADHAFTPDEIAAIEAKCRRYEIEIMPLVQCIGHNGHIGSHEEYRHLFEPGAKHAGDLQLCPLNAGSFRLFTELACQIMAAHPGGRYFHIGADETRSLGSCPDCAAKVAQEGKGKLYADYINKVCAWVKARGRIPVIWDDMLSHYPDVVADIDRDLVIMYWDYWTTKDPSPIFVARPADLPQIADRSWKECDFAGLDEPEKTIARAYAEIVDVAQTLESTPAMRNFKPYLGDGLPKYFTAFPFFDFYRQQGFRVIGAPSALGNTMDDLYGMPNAARARANIRAFAAKCVNGGGLGLVTSSWYNFPPEILDLGIIDTAQHAWRRY